MAIKMRVNDKKTSVCSECGVTYRNTKEMYDMMIVDTKFTLCFDCVEKVFQKTLRASTTYNAKLKTKDDAERIRRYQVLKNEQEE